MASVIVCPTRASQFDRFLLEYRKALRMFRAIDRNGGQCSAAAAHVRRDQNRRLASLPDGAIDALELQRALAAIRVALAGARPPTLPRAALTRATCR